MDGLVCWLVGGNEGQEDKKIRICILITIVCMPFMCSLRLCVHINDKSIHSFTNCNIIHLPYKHQNTTCVCAVCCVRVHINIANKVLRKRACFYRLILYKQCKINDNDGCRCGKVKRNNKKNHML